MLNQNYAEAYVEVLDIINHMSTKDLAKVSKKFIKFLTTNASKEYKCKLDYSKQLKDMQLKEETKGLLALMYRDYWASEEERQELQKKFYINDQKYQEELRKKFNTDNIFKNRNNNKTIENSTSESLELIKYENNKWYKKIFNIILNFFRR